MKAKLVPVYYKSSQDPDFVKQMGHLNRLFSEVAEFLKPVALGTPMPGDADAAVFLRARRAVTRQQGMRVVIAAGIEQADEGGAHFGFRLRALFAASVAASRARVAVIRARVRLRPFDPARPPFGERGRDGAGEPLQGFGADAHACKNFSRGGGVVCLLLIFNIRK